ncbi:glycosyltransferase family 4 protein [Natranaeroarchaeum sulfidigenes]|uniref:glycosyltransferase family 4 protein n=1 Tax=Natranaeroarchaeum sulfidigenes TaxID=2784880 RepID=UPI001EE5C9A1|nr:glycosyltransferase family 4 protein [Natranaeroarchaeum sulfidigenes]
MRVDLVTHRYPPDLGGIERHVAELARWLAGEGHDVTVHATDWDGSYDRETQDGAIRVRRYPAVAPGEAYYVSPHIARAVYRSDADVVHAHGYHSFPLLFAALGARSTPLVVTPHYAGRGSSDLRKLLHRLYAPIGGRALRSADATIAVSEWERDCLRDDFGCDARVVPNGIDIDRFVAAEPEGRERPYLLSVGRLVEYKGVQHIIDALAKLPEYDLIIAGSGEFRAELEAHAAARGVDDRVEFLGYVPEDRLPGLYAGAAAHVFLSEYECYGLTVGESLAAGTPCVVRDATALSEWTEFSGCVGVEDVDAGLVAGAVREAVELTPHPDALMTWGEMSAEVLGVYEAVVEE